MTKINKIRIPFFSKFHPALIIFLLFLGNSFGQTSIELSNPIFNQYNNTLDVNYKITGSNFLERFYVKLHIKNSTGVEFDTIVAVGHNISGIKPNKEYEISCDLNANNIRANDYLTVKVTALKTEQIHRTLISSSIFPGLGSYMSTGKKTFLSLGIIAYGALASAVFFNEKYQKSYSDYKEEYNISNSRKLIANSEKQYLISNISLGLAATTWLLDIGLNLYRSKKRNKSAITSSFIDRNKLKFNMSYDKLINSPTFSLSYNLH